MIAYWDGFRVAVDAAKGTLAPEVVKAAWAVYEALPAGEQAAAELVEISPECAGPVEWLRCVDEEGAPARLPAGWWVENSALLDPDSEWARRWFTRVEGEAGPELLVGRWLCHAIGLRHKTIHLFLDLPGQPGFVLLQVRGPFKHQSPGGFDLPVAGHIDGLSTEVDALMREMNEELGLLPDYLEDLRRIGGYCRESGGAGDRFVDREYHAAFRARLTPLGWERIRPVPPEVAGLAAFSFDELLALMRQFPSRFAPGIRGAVALLNGRLSG